MNEEIVYNDEILQIKEIMYQNFQLKQRNIPWYAKIANKLPQKLITPFLWTCSFYSRPYKYSYSSGSLYVKGIRILTSPEMAQKDHSEVEFPLDIGIVNEIGVYFKGTMSTWHWASSNLYFFENEGNNVPRNNKKIKVIVSDHKQKNIIREMTFEPEWEIETYNFLQRRPPSYGFSPELAFWKFILFLQQGKKEEARRMIYPEIADRFPWANIEHDYWKFPHKSLLYYEGEYFGFEDVFSMTLTFSVQKTDNGNVDFTGVAEQKIYIIDKEGTWQIVDIKPLVELNSGTKP